MHRNNKIFLLKLIAVYIFGIYFSNLTAQHRGDNLAFQGLSNINTLSVKASAMGGAYTSVSGDLGSLFFNPAGIAGIKNIQFNISAKSSSNNWRETQDYRPDRYFVTLPFYLEGYYVPDPANDGIWDYELAKDSSYFVNQPLLGKDPYSEEASDWKKNKDNFGINNISIALPFQIMDNEFAAAAAFSSSRINDFDMNDTYLSPHIGYFDYGGDIKRVNGQDTLNMEWSRFARERFGSMKNITGALAYQFNDMITFGLGMNYKWGESDDQQSLNRVGEFQLNNQQEFRFYHINASQKISGTSKYNSFGLNIGAIVKLQRFQFGINISLPYTMEREYNYSKTAIDSLGTSSSNISGTDKFNVPAIYNFGFSFNPVDNFLISFDYEYAPLSKASFDLANPDDTFRDLVDCQTVKFGAEYRAFDFLSFMGGYKNVPRTFVPDGAAMHDKGPEGESFNLGLSFNLFLGRIDVAYEINVFKYYDSYYSNTNYVYESADNLLFGFTYSF